jgi:two-component system, response regulator
MEQRVIEILLIEDDVDDAELTIYTLKKHNLVNTLHHIDDGEKALQYLFDPSAIFPKLILLDLRMPRVDGIQILKKLKSDPEKRNTPVIALISSRDGKSYLESQGVKADGYIVKPLDFKKFVSAMAEVGVVWKIVNTPVAS